jgi:malonate-semialdehyde dehydrogenase (acetylating)/methylmalonate-semialdehyde dehydrogenase
VYDPATGEQTHEVDFADVAELNQAVEAAKEALPAWRATSLSKRAEIMFRIRELLDARKTDVATVLTVAARQGALGRDGRGAARARERRVRDGDPALAEGWLLRTGLDRRRRVRDPAAARASWRASRRSTSRDGPIWMCANAMACGNTFILKPSEKDPGAALVLAELFATPGCPTACSTSSRATRSPSTGSWSTPTSGR